MGKYSEFSEYVDWMYSRGRSNSRLETIKLLLDRIDNPQDKIKVIHVAGTNGKGSTSNFLASSISKKKRCGLFVSPYMFTITDSIKINGEEIAEGEFIELLEFLMPHIKDLDEEGHRVSYFEILTAVMYKYFYDKKVDVAVVEVGLGGRWDATNVIKEPLASVIVTISVDHVNVMGKNIEEIAENKAGIIKPKRPVFVYPQPDNIQRVFDRIARENDAPLFTYSMSEVEILELKERENIFNFRNYKNMKSRLVGIHQVYNASLALMVLDYLKDLLELDEQDIRSGIYDSINVGRLQFVSENPRVLFDGSHNAESINVLKKSLKAFKYDKLIIGFSVLKDKDYIYVIKEIASLADQMVVTTIDNPDRAFDVNDLVDEVKKISPNVVGIANRVKAYEFSKSLAGSNDLVLWCGSLYLLRDLLVYIKENGEVK